MKVWALIPARAGSKSIIGKNMAPLGDRPLMEYGILAAKASGCFERICCSTDGTEIANLASSLGVEVDHRPSVLVGDEVPVSEVAKEWLSRQPTPPEIVALIQPTSPFLLPDHIKQSLTALEQNTQSQTVQTICPVPHNYHAWNQREAENGLVTFRFAKERAEAYNKQRKPVLYKFGNLVAARSITLMEGFPFFEPPSEGVEIVAPYDFDVDTQFDLGLAEALLAAGMIQLPHISR